METMSSEVENVRPQVEGGVAATHDLLLIVFIHGFKGTDSTFEGFPERLRHIVSETISNVVVESIVFPAYETKGELDAAVESFGDWLTTLVVERENANGVGGGAGKAKVVLIGHSMGGLVAADALLGIEGTRPDHTAPLWPKIIACLAFDTPYLGLHPFVFKSSVTKAVQTAHQFASAFGLFSSSKTTKQAASNVPSAAITAPPAQPAQSSSSWSKWASPTAYGVGGLLLGSAVAGAAYYKKDDLGVGYKWATDHLKYVGTLWDEEKLKNRLDRLVEIEEKLGVVFRDFYTLLPPHLPDYPNERTFIILPQQRSPLRSHFIPARNSIAEDEVEAHTNMFNASKNDDYYGLGLEASKLIRLAVMTAKGAGTPPPEDVHIPTAPSEEGNFADVDLA